MCSFDEYRPPDFVNRPVRDLDRTIRFFYPVRFTFTDQNAASMVIAPNIHAMLPVGEFISGFISDTDPAPGG